jgi:hypothetical protein
MCEQNFKNFKKLSGLMKELTKNEQNSRRLFDLISFLKTMVIYNNQVHT